MTPEDIKRIRSTNKPEFIPAKEKASEAHKKAMDIFEEKQYEQPKDYWEEK